MKYVPSIPQPMMNRYMDGTPARKATQFPINLAQNLPMDTQKEILLFLMQKYIWPQIMERMPFEYMWDKLLDMSLVTTPANDLFSNTTQDDSRAKQTSDQSNRDKARVTDSVIHDAIERLTDITYFIAFKDSLPIQYALPEYIEQPLAVEGYDPARGKIKAGNAILLWNSENHSVKRNSLILYRHHYTYGVSFVMSDFKFRVELVNRQMNDGSVQPQPEITEIGTTFEPISIRKIWLNWRLPVYEMDLQPCPFFFEETPRFAVMENKYDPIMNPFGYVNFDKLVNDSQYIYSSVEMQSVRTALASLQNQMRNSGDWNSATAQILEPIHSVEARWTMFPMLPLDPKTGQFDADGSLGIPYQRFIVETFGPNIHSGSQVFLRIQENYFPNKRLPLYATTHMPNLDSGAYAPAIGQILYNHYKEITICMEQFLTNKDWINDPPSWVQNSSPAADKDLNAKGAKIRVNGPNDFGWRLPYDATSSTVAMIQMLKDDAKTTSKAVDAILGKAMGSRTTATEASNAFQASMSAITTDIDILTLDAHGNYALRVWDYTGLWFDPDLLQEITGQFGFMMKPEDMHMHIGVNTNVASTYVEKIVKQQNVQYVLQASNGDPSINRPELWKQLFELMGLDSVNLVNDQGLQQQQQFANMQACQTFLGYPVHVDPDQNHQIAITVKTAYLKDQFSVWMTTPEYAKFAPALVQQIQQHQLFIQLQMQMQAAQQQAAVAQAQLKVHQENPPPTQKVPGGSLQTSSQPLQGAAA